MEDVVVKGLIFGVVIVVFYALIRLIKLAWHAARRVTAEGVARTAGTVSAHAVRKTESLTEAFKRGYDSRRS